MKAVAIMRNIAVILKNCLGNEKIARIWTTAVHIVKRLNLFGNHWVAYTQK